MSQSRYRHPRPAPPSNVIDRARLLHQLDRAHERYVGVPDASGVQVTLRALRTWVASDDQTTTLASLLYPAIPPVAIAPHSRVSTGVPAGGSQSKPAGFKGTTRY